MPEAAGIALGVDRLAMVLLDIETIDQVVSFAPEDL
jgi:lysyl-tRNA synthetase class 2